MGNIASCMESPQCKRGLQYYQGRGVKQDYAKALRCFEAAGEAGDAFAMGMAGAMRCDMQDYASARQWLGRAAEQGLTWAHCKLGEMYERGLGVRQDKAEAKELYGRACDLGDQHGCDEYRRLNEAGF